MDKVKDVAMSEGAAALAVSRLPVAMVLTNPRLPDNPIVYVNAAFEHATGYSRAAAVGRNCRFLQGEQTDPGDVRRLGRAIHAGQEISIDILNYTAAGQPFLNRLIISPIPGEDGTPDFFLGIQKRMTGEDVSADLDLVDRSLDAVQDRVREHLAIVVRMIRKQSRDAAVVEDFASLARRIECIQLLNEELLPHDQSDEVELGTYLTRIAASIAHVDGRPGVRLTLDAARMQCPVDTALRLGLIVSEILTNAFQHAFNGRRAGLVELRMSELTDGGCRVLVADDGVGLRDTVNWPRENTMGGRLVFEMIDGLGGSVDVNHGASGTVITIEVPRSAMDQE